MSKNYTFNDYAFGETIVRYVIMNETKRVFMMLIPKDTLSDVCDDYNTYPNESQFSDYHDFRAGALCHLHLSHHYISPCCDSMRLGQSFDEMYFKSQKKIDLEDKTVIETEVVSDEGYRVIHKLTNYNGEGGFEVECVFVNDSDRDFRLEMLTSASLDSLSPYQNDDSSRDIYYHTFKSGWALEGRHLRRSIAELNLNQAWGGSFECYKIGTNGSRPTANYFPYAALEDEAHGIIWGMKLAHNASWQMELLRYGIKLSLSCGIGDLSYSNWAKTVKPNESFAAPKAYVAAVKGGIADLSYEFEKMHRRDVDAYGEKDSMAIIFNEYCTPWGKPTHENNIKLADKLKDSKAKYFVMDGGWYNGTIGDWDKYKKDKFPYGLKTYADEIRKRGLIPGIWFEFESVAEGAGRYGSEYDHMYLKHDGIPIRGQVNKGRREKFIDFSNPDAIEFLDNNVIKLLKDNGFGYIKVDYNSNMGICIDGEESAGEALRKNQEAVRNYFIKMKKEIPDLIIENCASGGMRLEPSMMAVSAMASFSDTHECVDFPIVAANMHYLIMPRQSQIWCVLNPEFDDNRFSYTISAGFLGRICWSGDFVGMSDKQMDQVYRAENFYEEVSDIIRCGKSIIYRTEKFINNRYPKGTQAVIRYSDDGDRALLVYHCFETPEKLEIPLVGKWEIEKSLYECNIDVNDKIVIDENREICANVVLLKKA